MERKIGFKELLFRRKRIIKASKRSIDLTKLLQMEVNSSVKLSLHLKKLLSTEENTSKQQKGLLISKKEYFKGLKRGIGVKKLL